MTTRPITGHAKRVTSTCFWLQILHGEQSWHQNLFTGQMDQSRASVWTSVLLLLRLFWGAWSVDWNLSHSLTRVFLSSAFKCEFPPADGEVVVKGLPENEQAVLPDRFLSFSCRAPGKYLNGSSLLICGKDGQWDNAFPTCEGGNWEQPWRRN